MKTMNLINGFVFSVVVTAIGASSAVAGECTYNNDSLRHDVRWSIGGESKFAILQRHQNFKKNGEVEEDQVRARVLEYIQSVRSPVRGVTDGKLADLITKANAVTGTSFEAITGIAHQESNICQLRHNKGGGDSGCMQFTSIAIQELKNQFGVGELASFSNVETELVGWADEFFGLNEDGSRTARRQAFSNWIQKDKDAMRIQLRSPGHEDIDIFAGAVLLKIYYAANNGDYIAAIRGYNGGGDARYADKILNKAYKVNYECDTEKNLISQAYAEEVLSNICEVESQGDEEAYSGCMFKMTEEEVQAPLYNPNDWT